MTMSYLKKAQSRDGPQMVYVVPRGMASRWDVWFPGRSLEAVKGKWWLLVESFWLVPLLGPRLGVPYLCTM